MSAGNNDLEHVNAEKHHHRLRTEMMQAAGSAKLVYLAWIVGGVLSFFGALTYAELGALKPEAGGEYVYVRDGYGPLAGFLAAV